MLLLRTRDMVGKQEPGRAALTTRSFEGGGHEWHQVSDQFGS